MKKSVRITLWVLGLILLLQVGGVVLLQSPRVQTFLGKKVISMLQDRMDADITFQSASVRPFDAIVLDEVLVKDIAPVLEDMDTLLYVKHLSARFSIMGLFRGESISVSRLNLNGGCFHLVIEPDPDCPARGTTNLQRIFRIPQKERNEPPQYHWGNILEARSVEVSQVHFHMENMVTAARYEQRGKVIPEGTIDWNHLNLNVEHLKVNHLRLNDDLITGSVQDFFVQELTTGLRLDNLSAQKVRVGKGNVHVEDFLGHLGPGNITFLDMPLFEMEGTLEEYNDFEQNVRFNATLNEGSQIDMQTIRHLAPKMDQITFRGRIKGHVQGPLSDFRFSEMRVEGLDDEVVLVTDGRMTGLPDAESTRMNFLIHELSFGLKDLDGFIQSWAPATQLNTDRMAPGERFTANGTLSGVLDRLQFQGEIDSRIGHIKTDVALAHIISHKLQPLSIEGRLETRDVQVGHIIGNKDLGAVSLTTSLTAALEPGDLRVQVDTLEIDRLQALGYNYSGISAQGRFQANDYRFHLQSTDPNLKLQADATYYETSVRDGQLEARLQLDFADLEALHLDKRGRSKVALNAQAGIIRTDGHAKGRISTDHMTLENDGGRYDISDIGLNIEAEDSLHILSLRSDLLDADYKGTRSILDCFNEIKTLLVKEELPALLPKPAKPYSGATYEGVIVAKELQDLMAFVAPGVYVEKGTKVRFSVSPEGAFNADLNSGRLALREQYIKDLRLHADNANEALTGEITSSAIALSPGARLSNNRLTFHADNNKLGLGYSFDNEEEEDTRAEFFATGELAQTQQGLSITARAHPSNIYYKGDGWGIQSGDIHFCNGDLQVNRLEANHNHQRLVVDGRYSQKRTDTLSVTMDQFNIALVNSIAGENFPQLQGRATGQAFIVSAPSAQPGLLANIVCDSTAISGRRVGQLNLSSSWNEKLKRFDAHMRNTLDGRSSIMADAFLVPSTDELQVSLQLDRFELGYAEHFLNSIFHEFNGALSGEIKLDGKRSDLRLSSQDLWLDDGRLTLDFTRVPYQVNGPLSLDKKGLHFEDMYVTDGEGGTGTVTGGIEMNLSHLENMRMDTHVNIREMRAISLPRGVNPLAFGQVYATGRVDITGPMNKLNLAIDATSAKSGEFHLPLGSSSASGKSRELLTFQEADSLRHEDPYEQMMASARHTHKKQSDLLFTARIKATPDLRVYIDIGDGNTLNAIGSGTIELESSSAQGSFTLGGDYTILDGNFHFGVLGLVSRDFTIQGGSTIRFNGDVWDTDLDVKGLYTTKTQLTNLLSTYEGTDNNSTISNRRTVNCGIDITGKIKNPEVGFNIEIPDLNPVIQGQVESALNTEDKVQKQFVYLLVTGGFLPTEDSGVTNDGSSVLLSNVTSIMAGQLNNIFQKLDIPLDLGLTYQTTQTGRDMFDVAVSTQLFNNRVIVNGTVGSKQMVGGTSTNEIAGDLDIEIKLNRSGSLRINLFSHSADQYTNYLDNSQRNGGGIAYQREFNSFGQFFRELFASRKEREAMALEAANEQKKSVVLTIDSNGKSEITHEIR